MSLNDYILCEIYFEQRQKEPKVRYSTLSLNDYILCEICFEQRHKESKWIVNWNIRNQNLDISPALSLNDYVVFEIWFEKRTVNCNL